MVCLEGVCCLCGSNTSLEHIQHMISDNRKKWNQLIMNLHTEVSLSRSIEQSRASRNSFVSHSRSASSGYETPATPRTTNQGNLKASASESMLYPLLEICTGSIDRHSGCL